ncbi:MAG: DUF2273 domain-containing protein [Christensenellaceae bacterium]|jgi:uncharacterized membrane protein|nr:DUF2273 domain-containing protein [Christensenellaceae bacterium]
MFKALFQRYFFTVLMAALGLLAAILFLTLGFWRGLVLLALVAGGAALGYWLDQSPDLRELVERLFHKGGESS